MLGGEFDQSLRFRHGRGERLVDDYVAPSEEAGPGQLEMRLVRSRDHAEADRFVGKQFVQRASDADVGIRFAGERSVTLENAGQFHACYSLNHGSVK